MAHDPSRTERATPRRRQKAREEGSVLRVPDLDAAILLWGNFFLFMALWGGTLLLLGRHVADLLARAGQGSELTEATLRVLALDVFGICLKVVLPYMGANLLLALLNQFLQHGFKPIPKLMAPKFEKLNPIPGFKRLFSARSLIELLKSLLKFLILLWMAYIVLGPRIPSLIMSFKHPLSHTLQILQDILFLLYRNVMIAMLILSLADYFYQKHEYEKSIRMTKQEVKDEAKDAEGSPEVKGRQRSLMYASLIKRITTQVPKATVVITNPTHFAVALRYEPGHPAPICVAKGLDHLALKIRERAKACGVPVVENPPLARSLYRSVELDRPIPPELYQAVAQVLAFVYRLRGVA